MLWGRVRRSEKTPWIMACTFAVVLAVVLGIPLGWRFRGKELNIGLDTDWEGRFVSAIILKIHLTSAQRQVFSSLPRLLSSLQMQLLGRRPFNGTSTRIPASPRLSRTAMTSQTTTALLSISSWIRKIILVRVQVIWLIDNGRNLMSGTSNSNSPSSNNRPDQPLFQYNATASEYDDFASSAIFRTESSPHNFFSSIHSF